jgi:hypothetical protein
MRQAWVTAAALVAALAGFSEAQARCERSDYTIVPSKNSRATVQMIAESGKDCVIRLSATRRFTIVGRRIAEEPANGKVTIEGETAFYRSLPNFRGADRFVAEVTGKGSDGEGTSVVTVNVTVR